MSQIQQVGLAAIGAPKPRIHVLPVLRNALRCIQFSTFSGLTSTGYVVRVTVLADLAASVEDHQAHGQLVGDAGAPEPRGYRLTVICPAV